MIPSYSVNGTSTLTQEELFPLFSQATGLVMDCVRVLISHNDYVQHAIIQLGAEVASNLDRNRAIYRRNTAYEEDILTDLPADSEERERSFLALVMDLQVACIDGDKDRQLRIVRNMHLTRMVFENIVKAWSSASSGYVAAVHLSSGFHASGHIKKASDADLQLFKFENNTDMRDWSSYGVVRYVNLRLKKMKVIYDRIFEAYSRITLKMAKSHAVSEEFHLADCYQNGSFGLIRAISSYDHISNARFAGHARWWIRQSMLLHLKEHTNIIKISSSTWQHYSKLEDIRNKASPKQGGLSTEKLATLSGYSVSRVRSVYRTVRTGKVLSLDHILHESDNSSASFASMVAAPPEDDADLIRASANVSTILQGLDKDLRNLVCLNFGLTEYLKQDIDPLLISSEKRRQSNKPPHTKEKQ